MGAPVFDELELLDSAEKEQLRFSAERVHGASGGLVAETEVLLRVITRGRLSDELEAVMGMLKRSESSGNDAETSRLLGCAKALTDQIAALKD